MHVQRATRRRRRYVEQPDNRAARRGAGLRTVLSARTLVDGTGTARRTIGVMNGPPWSTERALRAQQGAGCLPQAASAWSCRCQHRTREHADRSLPAGCAPDDSPVWRSGPLHWSAGTRVRLDASRPASHGHRGVALEDAERVPVSGGHRLPQFDGSRVAIPGSSSSMPAARPCPRRNRRHRMLCRAAPRHCTGIEARRHGESSDRESLASSK